MASPPVISLEDYDAIAGAVMETERGRWFLAEFARRNRAADTQAVLEALAGIEARLADRPIVLRQVAEAPIEEAPVEQAADSGTVERIAAAAELTESLRAELAASNRQGRFVTRTVAQVEEIGRELALALQALRPGAARAEPTADPAEEEAVMTAPPLGPVAVEDARAAAEERRLAELYEELARPIEIEALEAVDAAPDEMAAASLSQEAAPELARSRGEENIPAIAAPRREIESGGAPHDHRRGALPRAWTPPLLDSLSDAEKAMLFA